MDNLDQLSHIIGGVTGVVLYFYYIYRTVLHCAEDGNEDEIPFAMVGAVIGIPVAIFCVKIWPVVWVIGSIYLFYMGAISIVRERRARLNDRAE